MIKSLESLASLSLGGDFPSDVIQKSQLSTVWLVITVKLGTRWLRLLGSCSELSELMCKSRFQVVGIIQYPLGEAVNMISLCLVGVCIYTDTLFVYSIIDDFSPRVEIQHMEFLRHQILGCDFHYHDDWPFFRNWFKQIDKIDICLLSHPCIVWWW